MNFNIFKKIDKYIVIFCVKEGNTYNKIDSKSIKPDTTEIQYGKEKLFDIDVENPTFRVRDTRFFWIDVNAKQIYFKELESKDFVPARLNKMIRKDNIIYQLAKASKSEVKPPFNWNAFIMGVLLGVIGGFITAMIMFGGVF